MKWLFCNKWLLSAAACVCVCVCVCWGGNRPAYMLQHNSPPPLVLGGGLWGIKAFPAHEFITAAFLRLYCTKMSNKGGLGVESAGVGGERGESRS